MGIEEVIGRKSQFFLYLLLKLKQHWRCKIKNLIQYLNVFKNSYTERLQALSSSTQVRVLWYSSTVIIAISISPFLAELPKKVKFIFTQMKEFISSGVMGGVLHFIISFLNCFSKNKLFSPVVLPAKDVSKKGRVQFAQWNSSQQTVPLKYSVLLQELLT